MTDREWTDLEGKKWAARVVDGVPVVFGSDFREDAFIRDRRLYVGCNGIPLAVVLWFLSPGSVRGGRSEQMEYCWHCGDGLEPSSRPHCERCPSDGECDIEGCDEPGCGDERRDDIASEPANWLDLLVARCLDRNIDRLAKGRDYIVRPSSRKLLHAVVHNVVLDVLTEMVAGEQG